MLKTLLEKALVLLEDLEKVRSLREEEATNTKEPETKTTPGVALNTGSEVFTAVQPTAKTSQAVSPESVETDITLDSSKLEVTSQKTRGTEATYAPSDRPYITVGKAVINLINNPDDSSNIKHLKKGLKEINNPDVLFVVKKLTSEIRLRLPKDGVVNGVQVGTLLATVEGFMEYLLGKLEKSPNEEEIKLYVTIISMFLVSVRASEGLGNLLVNTIKHTLFNDETSPEEKK